LLDFGVRELMAGIWEDDGGGRAFEDVEVFA
jgi:hypothetical protein